MEKTIDKILIVVKGGVVQSIYSSNPDTQFEVLDFDNEQLSNSVEEENILNLKINGLEAIL